jgi:hypothetical protein
MSLKARDGRKLRNYFLERKIEDSPNVICINIFECTKTYLKATFCRNHNYYTPDERYDAAAMQIIKTAHETHTPAFDIYVGIYDDDWCLNDIGWVVSYNDLIQEGEDLFNLIKEWVEHNQTIPPINLNAPIVLPECEIPTTVSEDPDLPF